ncbi:MAG: hypothetical protein A3G39_08185 [Deltaproteobacteria bacterium RIFCSPLOWO2_12_FULL_43_16]|nr:MAG: hypothetical protein A2Z89_10665 [Deltaproteobacteria bacterium GWA2_43_19]OGQ10258.1 MAG: hypothetical protein A3D30_08940 [Deltaproteobacteria bacterium RIFCSPHIGHO2_02_FULL_43_33]OGQ57606.1 MAG: hypothetical protein A3G39_08185 [Deltaproteobacteria bacterium RIFCSPLOWO2_12_FULL_43_16]HBR17714.1 hypothetical protein [Deltaproteobacteria bacterium]
MHTMKNTDLRLEKLLFTLDALAELSEELTSPKDFHRIMRSSLYMVMGNFAASKGAIFQFDQQKKIFKTMATKGLSALHEFTMQLSEETLRKLTGFKTPIDLHDKEKSSLFLAEEKSEFHNMHARVLMPLVVKENFLGLISIGKKFANEDYTQDDFKLMAVMAHHIAYSLYSQLLLKNLMHKYDENKKLYENLSHIYYDTIHAFARAIDAKDAYTKGHSHRVSTYSAAIAKEMKVSHEEIEGISIAGLLHDIGKIAIDRSIINKDSPLTTIESIELNSHPIIGYEILSKVKFPWTGISSMARNHHERIDGTGYPDRLQKGQIPLGAKIMSLADSFDAMTTNRPYRSALTAKQVLTELKANCGKQFDWDVIKSFFSLIWKEVTDKAKPTIMPLLNDSFARELKNELKNGSIKWFYPPKRLKRA